MLNGFPAGFGDVEEYQGVVRGIVIFADGSRIGTVHYVPEILDSI